jgi:hypothetical protein
MKAETAKCEVSPVRQVAATYKVSYSCHGLVLPKAAEPTSSPTYTESSSVLEREQKLARGRRQLQQIPGPSLGGAEQAATAREYPSVRLASGRCCLSCHFSRLRETRYVYMASRR